MGDRASAQIFVIFIERRVFCRPIHTVHLRAHLGYAGLFPDRHIPHRVGVSPLPRNEITGVLLPSAHLFNTGAL